MDETTDETNDEKFREEVDKPCATPQQLRTWIKLYTGLVMPRHAVCPDHHSPFEYIRRAYFEPARDLVIWAPRGGGKTRLGALATLLDLLHKPGCAIRILGGSFEQSLRMWEHLVPDLSGIAKELIEGKLGSGRRITLKCGSTAGVLTQSQRAVRGLRVQKLRCDEVELFDEDVWEAAQLVTKSKSSDITKISGAIEAISTLHTPFGLMNRIVESAQTTGTLIIKWCLLEVLERCPADRECKTCPLWEECRGVAKEKCDGFVSIDDAIAMKRRVSKETWECEMLCRRPSVRGCVFPNFDRAIHVKESRHEGTEAQRHEGQISLAIDFGFANPFVCLWIITGDDGVTHVIDEYIQQGRPVSDHIDQIKSRPWPAAKVVACDPAGAGRNEQTAESNVTLLRKAGFSVRHRASRIVEGIEMIRCALRPASGEPRLFVHPRCTRLIKALTAYRYAEGSEQPIKDGEHDHLIDALRYHFVNRRGEPGVVKKY